ncbi:conserved hypothetical protein [Ricinus communis]|uniref:Uncharacterized protein n=1 Tax=Ricinus communis TaxID=3988 RepID=B9SKZ8_RICCO|nr:conserved hypothetical protein [Ricinus communis]
MCRNYEQMISGDGDMEGLARLQADISHPSKVYATEVHFKITIQGQRKQSWAYEPLQGHGILWGIHRYTSYVGDNSIFLYCT